MISSNLSSKISSLKGQVEDHYGWHLVIGAIGKAKSEHIRSNTSVNKYVLLPEKLKRVAGIKNVFMREFIVSFTLDNSEKSFHLLMFRCEKDLESNIAFAWREFKAGGISSVLSLGFLHKMLFFGLFVAFFMSRFGCSKYDTLDTSDFL